MSLAKTKMQVVDLATENKQLREALQALFDECVIADIAGELSEAITGETLDKVRKALKSRQTKRAPDAACPCGETETREEINGSIRCVACDAPRR
jgi:hypothetical protein